MRKFLPLALRLHNDMVCHLLPLCGHVRREKHRAGRICPLCLACRSQLTPPLFSTQELEAKYDGIMAGLNLLHFILMRDMGSNLVCDACSRS